MTTSSGHTTAILASKVKGTNVYNDAGEKIGQVEDIILDKQSNRILFAALGFGGFVGIGEKYYPVPWSMLNYSDDKGGYVVPLTKETTGPQMTYRIGMAVRAADQEWKRTLNRLIMENQTEINKLLISYNIPILDETNMPITAETLSKRP